MLGFSLRGLPQGPTKVKLSHNYDKFEKTAHSDGEDIRSVHFCSQETLKRRVLKRYGLVDGVRFLL